MGVLWPVVEPCSGCGTPGVVLEGLKEEHRPGRATVVMVMEFDPNGVNPDEMAYWLRDAWGDVREESGMRPVWVSWFVNGKEMTS